MWLGASTEVGITKFVAVSKLQDLNSHRSLQVVSLKKAWKMPDLDLDTAANMIIREYLTPVRGSNAPSVCYSCNYVSRSFLAHIHGQRPFLTSP
jgi:hypothetical protein